MVTLTYRANIAHHICKCPAFYGQQGKHKFKIGSAEQFRKEKQRPKLAKAKQCYHVAPWKQPPYFFSAFEGCDEMRRRLAGQAFPLTVFIPHACSKTCIEQKEIFSGIYWVVCVPTTMKQSGTATVSVCMSSSNSRMLFSQFPMESETAIVLVQKSIKPTWIWSVQ